MVWALKPPAPLNAFPYLISSSAILTSNSLLLAPDVACGDRLSALIVMLCLVRGCSVPQMRYKALSEALSGVHADVGWIGFRLRDVPG